MTLLVSHRRAVVHPRRQLQARVQAELLQEIPHIDFDRAIADPQFTADLFIAHARSDQGQGLSLALGQVAGVERIRILHRPGHRLALIGQQRTQG